MCDSFDNCGPVFQELPSFLAENNYRDITNTRQTALQKAFNHDMKAYARATEISDPTAIDWLHSQPLRFSPLQHAITELQAGALPWYMAYPFEQKARKVKDGIVLVDISGVLAQQCQELLRAFPDLHDRLVLQDLPKALRDFKVDGVKVIEHDFNGPNPVKGMLTTYSLRWSYQCSI
jgi:demethylsterigmatocystin 6-O-methyltransferase